MIELKELSKLVLEFTGVNSVPNDFKVLEKTLQEKQSLLEKKQAMIRFCEDVVTKIKKKYRATKKQRDSLETQLSRYNNNLKHLLPLIQDSDIPDSVKQFFYESYLASNPLDKHSPAWTCNALAGLVYNEGKGDKEKAISLLKAGQKLAKEQYHATKEKLDEQMLEFIESALDGLGALTKKDIIGEYFVDVVGSKARVIILKKENEYFISGTDDWTGRGKITGDNNLLYARYTYSTGGKGHHTFFISDDREQLTGIWYNGRHWSGKLVWIKSAYDDSPLEELLARRINAYEKICKANIISHMKPDKSSENQLVYLAKLACAQEDALIGERYELPPNTVPDDLSGQYYAYFVGSKEIIEVKKTDKDIYTISAPEWTGSGEVISGSVLLTKYQYNNKMFSGNHVMKISKDGKKIEGTWNHDDKSSGDVSWHRE